MDYDNTRRKAIAEGKAIAKKMKAFQIEEGIHPDSEAEALRRLEKCFLRLQQAQKELIAAEKAATEDARVRNQRERRRKKQ